MYNATEGADPFVELCAVLTKGDLEKEAIVTFSTSDGSATSVCKLYYMYVVGCLASMYMYSMQCCALFSVVLVTANMCKPLAN